MSKFTLKEFVETSGGAYEVAVAMPEDVIRLLEALWMGIQMDEKTATIAAGIWDWSRRTRRIKPGKGRGPLCMGCEHEFNRKSAAAGFVVMTSFAASRDTAVITGICPTCIHRNPNELMQETLHQWRNIQPDAYAMAESRA